MKKINYSEDVYLVEDFLTSEECDDFIAFSEKKGFERAKVNLDGRQVEMTMVRNNERLLHTDYNLATTLWLKLRAFHALEIENTSVIGLNELFRFYKYSVGQRFKRHRDGSFVRNEQEFSCYTFMVYLNDDFMGGETAFEDFIIQPKKGMALVFKHALKHEGKPLIEGFKYVLRSDIMVRINEENE